MLADVVYQADEAQQQRQHVVFVACLVLLHVLRQVVLRAETAFVDELDAADPVAVQVVARTVVVEVVALVVVLATGEVPHEVAPVHPAQLVAVEELEVLSEGGLLSVVALASPVLVEARVVALGVVAPHAREEARVLLVVYILLCMGGNDVAVLPLRRLLPRYIWYSLPRRRWGVRRCNTGPRTAACRRTARGPGRHAWQRRPSARSR